MHSVEKTHQAVPYVRVMSVNTSLDADPCTDLGGSSSHGRPCLSIQTAGEVPSREVAERGRLWRTGAPRSFGVTESKPDEVGTHEECCGRRDWPVAAQAPET